MTEEKPQEPKIDFKQMEKDFRRFIAEQLREKDSIIRLIRALAKNG